MDKGGPGKEGGKTFWHAIQIMSPPHGLGLYLLHSPKVGTRDLSSRFQLHFYHKSH